MAAVYWQETAEAISLSTGIPMDAERLKAIGERIYNLQRMYNAVHGVNSKDDVLPWRFTLMPSTSGNASGSTCRLDITLPDYYRLRNWDPDSGLPEAETAARLGLEREYQQMMEQIGSGNAAAIRAAMPWAAPYTEGVPAER